MENIFTKSPNCKDEYSISIVKVGKIHDIPGADRIGQIYLNGQSLVVGKKDVKEGECYFYIPIEVVLDGEFLYKNNMYDIYHYEGNSNAAEVKKILDEAELLSGDAKEEKLTEARRLCGLFSRNRTRVAKIRKVPSYGLIVDEKAILKYKPELKKFFDKINLEDYEGTIFDTIDGTRFCKPYVPKLPRRNHKPRKKTETELFVEKYFSWVSEKYQRKIVRIFQKKKKRKTGSKKFGEGILYFIPGQLEKHYDTQQLGQNIQKIDYKNDIVDISLKVHGTSVIIGNVLREYDKPDLSKFDKKWNKFVRIFNLPKKYLRSETYKDYGYILSTRKVIQNKDMNPDSKVYKNKDVYGPYLDIFENNNLIEPGMTIYGEIFGYFNNEDKCVQKSFDYGCEPGTNKLMIYRITVEDEDGKKTDMNISDVIKWTENLLEKHPVLKDKIVPLKLLYHGKLIDRYPDIDEKNWKEDVILKLKNDKEFHMEEDEPLCVNKVPREGIVIRIEGDSVAEAFKAKTDKFYEWEGKQVDKGEVDIEMCEYSEETEEDTDE